METDELQFSVLNGLNETKCLKRHRPDADRDTCGLNPDFVRKSNIINTNDPICARDKRRALYGFRQYTKSFRRR